jgi:hypothetical protein
VSCARRRGSRGPRQLYHRLELVVDYYHCKHSFLSEALGDQHHSRATPRGLQALHLQDWDFVRVDVTARVIALCAVVGSYPILQGMAPTVTRLLEAGPQVYATDWTGGGRNWTERKASS